MASGCTITDNELATILSRFMNIDVMTKDVVECKPEFVQKMYIFFLNDFGTSIDKINHMPINAPASIAMYPDMFKSTCFLFGLAKTISYYIFLLTKATSDFGINDLIQPNRKRTKKFIVMFLEFYEYIYHNIDKYEAVEQEAEVEKFKFEGIRDRIKSLETEINDRKMKNAENEICLQKEMQQFAEAEKEFEKVQLTKNKLKGQLESIKNEIKAVVGKIKKTELEILEGKEEIQILESQIIQDEEMSKIKEQEALLLSLKNSNAELKNQKKDLDYTLQTIKENEKFITTSLLPLLEDIESENSKNKEADNLGNELKKLSLGLMEKLEDLSRSRQELIETVNILQEKHAMLQSAKEVKKIGLLEEIQQLRLNAAELQNSKEKQSSKEKDLVTEINKYKEEFKCREQKLRKFIAVLENSFNAIMKKVSEVDVSKRAK